MSPHGGDNRGDAAKAKVATLSRHMSQGFGPGSEGQAMQASPALERGSVDDQSVGGKGEACGWERAPVAEPVAIQGTRAGEQQRVVPRSSQHQHANLYGKG